MTWFVPSVRLRQHGRRRAATRHVVLHRPHHVILFVAEDVAVPHILPAEVDRAFVTVMAAPVAGSRLGTVALAGMLGFGERMLSGTPKGSLGSTAAERDDMSSSGFIRTVSFQPSSLGSGGFTAPSQPTRLITWTLNRWK